ncbi:unnamed protein product [Parnassius apollo]|uniref:(apollo) hypothetical protein n=1 Tax=Parnassius apollo TaxID=110799 RepID=A0A8S3Y5A9_PARAO|nr:unnamed protein product [Parnassius apollo]
MSKKKSRVWTFFDDVEREPTKVKCNQCQGIISRGGQGRKANTTSMTNHIKYKHNELMPQLAGSIKSSSNEVHLSSRSQSQPEPFSPTPVPSTSARGEVYIQQTIQDSVMVQWSLQDSRSREISVAIGEMIALDNQPLSIVENSGFISLMKKLKPKYVLPSRKYLSENIIPNIYEKTKTEIRYGVLRATALSVTTDLWTNTNNKESFLSFTAHWLDNDMKFRHAVLQMKHFPMSYDAHNIKVCLEEIPASWDISAAKIHAVVRDNGRNIAKAIDKSIFKAVPCFIHTMQLAIHDALKIDYVAQILQKSRHIVTHFNHSAPAQQKLSAIQKELNLPLHLLVQDISTRWNSSYYMMFRLLEQKRSVSLYVTENTVNFENLSTEEWKLLEKCITLLKPFEEVTKIISSSCCSISEVIPHLKY